MNMESFEEMRIPSENIERAEFLIEGETVTLQKWEDVVLNVELPKTCIMEVVYTEPGIKGDTAGGKSLKPCTVGADVEVMVPLYVNIGDKIKINIEEKAFM